MKANSLEKDDQSYKKLEGFTWGTDSLNHNTNSSQS